jgi:hypothetical protein
MNQWQPRRDVPNWHSNSPQGQSRQQQYQPQQLYQQPPVQVNVSQNGPRRAVTQGKLGYGEEMFHWMMIICSCGFWYPVYASRKRSKRSVTKFR